MSKCGSVSVEVLGTKKKFSKGKALGGDIITVPLVGISAPIGAMAGFVGKKGKSTCHCIECGNVFNKKL